MDVAVVTVEAARLSCCVPTVSFVYDESGFLITMPG